MSTEGTGRPVVVGVDGSPVSAEAVGYAYMQAAERGTGLTVVHAWQSDPFEESIGYASSDAFWSERSDPEKVVTAALRHELRQIGHEALQLRVLVLKLLQAPHLRRRHAVELLLPVQIGGLADPCFATRPGGQTSPSRPKVQSPTAAGVLARGCPVVTLALRIR